MEEERRNLLAELQELSLEAAIERLLDAGVLDAAMLSSRRDEHLRDLRGRSVERLGDELEALRRQARQQRRHAATQIDEAHRQRDRAGAVRETIVQLDEHRQALLRRRELARGELSQHASALEDAHRALGAALAALMLLAGREPYIPEADLGAGLAVEVERGGDRLVLRLAGEIDIATAPRLEAALDEATASGVEELWVDLVGVRFIDSTGISLLLRATNELAGPRRLAVICPDGPARRALELCGIGKLLALYAESPPGTGRAGSASDS
ncbi:MAG TPA: STAS domain-containing protein [Solirubrobacteraceae bacterium]|jgi:anti-anti-sigma factor